MNSSAYKPERIVRPTLDRPLSRRAVLRGAGGVAIGLPLLEVMSSRRAQAAGAKRFIFNYHSNGVNKDAWTPAGPETGFTLSKTLMPLLPLQSKLVVLSGINMESSRRNPGNPHNQGIASVLTGKRFIEAPPGAGHGYGSSISLDQFIAGKIGTEAKFPSLQFGVQTLRFYAANYLSYVSYSGPLKPVPCEDDPAKMFSRVFSDVGNGTAMPGAMAAQDERLARRKSVLDFVGTEFTQLAPGLPADDRAKIQAHLDKIREIERRLAISSAPTAGCHQPAVQNVPNATTKSDAWPAVGKLQMDLLAMALICDLTRVALMQWGTCQCFNQFTWLGSTRAHHSMSHETTAASLTDLQKIQQWFMEQLAYLGGALDAAKEPGGSILDNSALLSCSEVSVGNTHSHLDMPFLLLGGAGGAIKGGRHLRYPGTAHNDLHVSLLNAMGIPATTFGDPAYATGPLARLVG